MKCFALFALTVGLIASGDDPKPEDVKKEVEKLQGTWTISKIECGRGFDPPARRRRGPDQGGEAHCPQHRGGPHARPISLAQGDRSRIHGGTCRGPDGQGHLQAGGRYAHTLPSATKDGKRPTEFTAPEGSGKMLFVFKRRRPGETPGQSTGPYELSRNNECPFTRRRGKHPPPP